MDVTWARRLLVDDLAPRWLAGAVTDSGLFHAELDRQWRRRGRTVGTLVSQSRLLYVFGEAWRATGQHAYRDAVGRGADFLVERFPDTEHGGWFWSVGPDGAVLDDAKNSYGHAFVVFGLSHAYRLTGDPRHLAGALDAADVLHTRFRDARGGIGMLATREFVDQDTSRTQNPIMHLTEALLALASIPGQQAQLDRARQWVGFLFGAMAERGERMLHEDYTMAWTPPAQTCICLGHQLEWAYLLSVGVDMGLPERYLDYGHTILDQGWRVGWDAEHGGLLRFADADGRITNDAKGYWEQTETVRTLAHYAARRSRDDLRGALAEAVDYVRTRLVDLDYGGVYGQLDRQGVPTHTDKGGVWKVDYHTVGMCAELTRVGEEAG